MVCLSARALEAASGALEVGGGDRNRTRDLLLAKQTLYQLSYAPSHVPRVRLPHKKVGWPTKMVGLGGLEPPTLRLSGVRSNHLS
jgi:hypothetical protein